MNNKKNLLSALIALTLVGCSSEEGDKESEKIGLPSENVTKLKGDLSDATTFFILNFNNVSPKQLQTSKEVTNHNFYKMDGEGAISEAFTTPWTVHFSHTILSPDQQYLYALVDHKRVWDNETFLKYTRCGILKLSLIDGKTSCVVEDVLVQTPSGYGTQTNDDRFKPLQFDSKGNLYFLKAVFDFYEHGIDLSKGTEGYLSQFDPLTSEFKTISQESVKSFIVNPNDSLIYHDGELRWVTNLSDISGSESIVGGGNLWNTWYSLDDNGNIIFSNYVGSDVLSFAQLDSNRDVSYAMTNVDTSDVPGSLESISISDDGAIYGTYFYAKRKEGVYYWRHAVRRLLPFSESISADFDAAQNDSQIRPELSVKVLNQHVYYIERERDEEYGLRDVIKIGTLDDQITEVLFNGEWQKERLLFESWSELDGIIYFSAQDEVTGQLINGQIDTRKYLAGKSDYLSVDDDNGKAPYTIIDMEKIESGKVEQTAPKLLAVDTAEAELHSASLKFNVPMDSESLINGISVTNNSTLEEVEHLVIKLGRSTHVIFNPHTDGKQLTQPLEYNQAYKLSLDAPQMKSESGNLLEECELQEGCTSTWQTRPEKNYLLSVTNESEVKAPFDGKHLRSYDHSINVIAFGYEQDKERLFTDNTSKWGLEMTILPYDFRVDVDYEDDDGKRHSSSVLYKGNDSGVILTDVIPNQWFYSKIELDAKETNIRVTVDKDNIWFTVIDPKTGIEQKDSIPLNNARRLTELSLNMNGGEIQTIDNIRALSWSRSGEERVHYQQNFDSFSDTATMQATLEESDHFYIY